MTKVERHMDICKGLNEVYERKNHDYGDSFHDTFVEEGMAMARIRLSDKLGRFKKLTREGSEQKVNDESIRDTLLDLANYAIMTVMEMDILEEEEAKTELQTTIREHRNNLMELGRSSLVNRTFQIPKNSVSNGAPGIGEDPCKKCTYPGKETCCGCVDRIAWEKRQRSDTDAAEAEQADGR